MPWNFFRIHKLEDEKRLYSKFLVLFAKKTRQLLIPWAFFAFLLFAYLFVLKLNETHNWAKAISLPVTSMFDGFLGDENSFILFHVIWFLICLFEVSFVYLLIHKITPTIKH